MFGIGAPHVHARNQIGRGAGPAPAPIALQKARIERSRWTSHLQLKAFAELLEVVGEILAEIADGGFQSRLQALLFGAADLPRPAVLHDAERDDDRSHHADGQHFRQETDVFPGVRAKICQLVHDRLRGSRSKITGAAHPGIR